MLMDFAQTPRRFGAPRGGWHARGRPPHMYAPQRGRFLQPDPIGYGDGVNWYGYVGDDPVNGRDPSGLENCSGDTFNQATGGIGPDYGDCVVIGVRPSPGLVGGSGGGGGGLNYDTGNCAQSAIPMLCNSDGGGSDIIVTAIRKPPAALENGALPQKTESKACEILRTDSDSMKGNLPSYITGNDNWDNLRLLGAYKSYYQDNLNQGIAIGSVLGVYAGARTAVAVGRVAGSALATRLGSSAAFGPWGTIGSFVYGGIIAAQIKVDQGRVAALSARIKQLEACK